MSQQINLLLPELRPRFDWLGLPVVAAAALVALLLIVALSSFGTLRMENLKAREAELAGQLQLAQQQIQSFTQSLAARKGDAGLPSDIEATRLTVTQRQEVMTVISQGEAGASSGFSRLLAGFSRQAMEGVWLVGFVFSGKEIEIRGRLSDPALLPKYISRLNDEPAFAGRRFATLDMTGVDPLSAKRDAGPAATKPPVAKPYTEFALRTEQAPAAERGR